MTAPRRPPGRYDEPRALPAGRAPRVVGGVLALLALVAAYTAFTRYSSRTSTAAVQGFTVVSDNEVDVRFEVRKRPAATTYCVVRARAADGAEVGSTTVPVGPSAAGTVQLSQRLTTSRRANTGEVDSCSSHR